MNNDTIKAAEQFAFEAGDMRNNQKSFIAGAEYMQAQKLQQIDELTETVMRYASDVDELVAFVTSVKKYLPGPEFNKADKLIQKHKP